MLIALMIHPAYLISIGAAAILGWASFFVVINKLSPFTSAPLSLILFYLSLFFAFTGTFTLSLFYYRSWKAKGEIHSAYLNTALRQGVLLSLMVTVAALFQRLRVLTWWDGILLLAIVLLIEFYFMAKE
ncbi:hypothetical protein JXA05_02175 [Candidatus Peregrinibacteria bacterium]|nr:hypothetical protein [Candidatus Peregrinibacteria bacterium]